MMVNTGIPRDSALDSGMAMKREGYLFIKNRVEKYHSDVFRIRVMGMPMICMSGRDAAEVFYDPKRFQRSGAIPKVIQKTVTGENSVQNLDGEEHAQRRKIFLDLASERQQNNVAELVKKQWEACIPKWEKAGRIVLLDEARCVLCRAACQWCCVPIREEDVKDRAEDFYSILDTLSRTGGNYVKGLAARKRTEDWICSVMEDTRSGKLNPHRESALYQIAFYKQPDGSVLDLRTAAGELINVLLPTVVVATYVVFTAHALHEHPEWREKLRASGEEWFRCFGQEVRRYYPFAPFLGALVKKGFIWNHCRFPAGATVLLDLYGTDHDERIWEHPNEFRPERFFRHSVGLYDSIPTGGGDPLRGHRSPGEPIAAKIMEVSLDFLVNTTDYDTPLQDFGFPLDRMPTMINSGFLMTNIRRRETGR